MSASYTVKKGDSLSKIAAQNGVTLAQLIAANPAFGAEGRNINLIQIGEQISIPDSNLSPAKPAGESTQSCPPTSPSTVGAPAPSPLQAEIERKNKEHQKRADFAKGTSPQQSNKDSCALMSTRSVLAEATMVGQKCLMKPAVPLSENEMVEIGTKSGAYVPCSGTTDEVKLLETVGIEATSKQHPSLEDIANALDAGKGVIVGYDTRGVWGGQAAKSPKPLGHAVRVTGVIRNPESGQIVSLLINDTGDGTPKAVDAATFNKALEWPYSRMAETKYPLHPPI